MAHGVPHVTFVDTETSQDGEGKSFTSYILQVRAGGQTWKIQRRYSEFAHLHKKLGSEGLTTGCTKKFPEKILFKNMDPQKVERRKKKLEEYFDDLLRQPGVGSSRTLGDFLSIPFDSALASPTLSSSSASPAPSSPSPLFSSASSPPLSPRSPSSPHAPPLVQSPPAPKPLFATSPPPRAPPTTAQQEGLAAQSFCSGCGNSLGPAIKFCSGCGQKVEIASETFRPPSPPVHGHHAAASTLRDELHHQHQPQLRQQHIEDVKAKAELSQHHKREPETQEVPPALSPRDVDEHLNHKHHQHHHAKQHKEPHNSNQGTQAEAKKDKNEKKEKKQEKQEQQTDTTEHTSKNKREAPTGRVGNAWEKKMSEKALLEKEEERNKIRGRRGKAVAYMDNQIRTIISILQQHDKSITFGQLFQETQSTMDALAALLNTAKKRGVVQYQGDMLMQGQDDHVMITLLKDTIEDSSVFQSTAFDKEEVLQAIKQPAGPETCYICSKTVYQAERMAPNNKVMHAACFKCQECNSKLRLDAYCLNNGKFFCKPCYERMYRAAGGAYQF